MVYIEAKGMSTIWGAFLGLVQGLTEFLPVSSSGHLALLGPLTGSPPQNVGFDLLLHLATVLVVIQAFWKDFWHYWRHERMIIGYLIVGTVPAVIVGLLFRHELEALRVQPLAVCTAFLVTAAALTAADRLRVEPLALRRLGVSYSLVVGLCQALAIVPGISRSGSTIAGGILCGLEREDAVRFSFLLMVPVVLGASALEFLREPEAFSSLPIGAAIAGFLTALISGYGALKLLLHLVRRQRLIYFAIYCAVVAAAGIFYFAFRT